MRELGQPAPVFVYGHVTRGPIDGQWTNVQSITNGIWCSVTMTSDTPSVAGITFWKDLSGVPDQSGINVIQAVSDGHATVRLRLLATIAHPPAIAKVPAPPRPARRVAGARPGAPARLVSPRSARAPGTGRASDGSIPIAP